MSRLLVLGWFLVGALPALAQPAPGPGGKPWWSREVEDSLKLAGKNRDAMVQALTQVPEGQREGMAFLIANMPEKDLRSLDAKFLLENVRLAYGAMAQVPWGKKIPKDLFLNDILPYANVTEKRDNWRKEMMDLCLPLVKECKTPAEAAQRLNATTFAKLKVRYSTKRNRPDQSPLESISTGIASCTGLSILLVDACRSVGIPARVVGIPQWANKPGNHTWVEIWDKGWHFTGACEQDPSGLDRGWFVGDAALAKKDRKEHSIYAASFRRTGVLFPLVWAPGNKEVYAENVTERYAQPQPAKATTTRVMVRVWDAGRRTRLAVPVSVVDGSASDKVQRGTSRGESADTNDLLTFELARNHAYTLRVGDPVRAIKEFRTSSKEQLTIDIELSAKQIPSSATPPGLTRAQQSAIEKAAAAFFAASAAEQSQWKADATLDRLLKDHEAEVRQLVWKAYQAAPIHAALKKDYDNKQVRNQNHLSAYTVKQVGKKPKKGWPLFIAMHGGGGAPKAVNDSQWRIMQEYYRDQKSVEGYLYVALRAPNDTWNGFYDDYVCPLIVNLIREFTLFGEVDPDKVFLMGYSHGGYGAFFLGPKMPDRFAAIHASASAPTDGTISPRSLRNTRFTFMIGEMDNAYGRRKRCEDFNAAIEKLQKENPGEYPVTMEFKKGFGHGGLPDRDKIKEMYPATRNPVPTHLTWEPMDAHLTDFFWVSVNKPEKGQLIDVVLKNNKVEIKTQKIEQVTLWLDGRLVDLNKPLAITRNGKTSQQTLRPSLGTLCRSLLRRGDAQLAGTCEVVVQ